MKARLFDSETPLHLESGAALAPVDVAYETYGRLDDAAANAIVVCGFATGGAHAADTPDADAPGWWSSLIGPGKPLDTDRYFVVCADLLGGCRGTTGPASPDPATGRPYGESFPLLAVRDLVAVQRALTRHLGIERVHAALGGSLGGMQALQWALDAPEEVAHAVAIGASAGATSLIIGLDFAVRHALHARLTNGGGAGDALAAARMVALLTYLAEPELQRRFGRARRDANAAMTLAADFEVEHFLEHLGTRLAERFDPWSYLVLHRVSSYFSPFEDARLDLSRVAAAGTRVLAVSFTTDWRYGPEHAERIVATLAPAGIDARHVTIESDAGHDALLHAPPGYHEALRAFLTRP